MKCQCPVKTNPKEILFFHEPFRFACKKQATTVTLKSQRCTSIGILVSLLKQTEARWGGGQADFVGSDVMLDYLAHAEFTVVGTDGCLRLLSRETFYA